MVVLIYGLVTFATRRTIKQGSKFRSVPKTGTEHVMKNSGLCTGLFRSELTELPESDRYTYSGRNRGIDFSDINKKNISLKLNP